MNANEITYGIEIECVVDQGTTPVGAYHHGLQVPWLPEGWNAQRDNSLSTRRAGKMTLEIVSPVLKGADGLRQIQTVCRAIKDHGGAVNGTTGLHVHVGWPGREPNDLRRLVHLVANHEAAIYATTGTKKRERGGYCASIRRDFQGLDYARLQGTAADDRYHVLNLRPLMDGRPTVEFRAFAGTLNAVKIISYVRLAVALVQRAVTMRQTLDWQNKPAAETRQFHRAGAGQSEVCRFAACMGWSRTLKRRTWGDVTGDGLPSMERTVNELMRLAAKYDAQP